MIDLNEFFKTLEIDISQKRLLIPFIVSLPASYSTLWLYWEDFQCFDIFTKIIFAITATISVMLACYFIFAVVGKSTSYFKGNLTFSVWICYVTPIHVFISTTFFDTFPTRFWMSCYACIVPVCFLFLFIVSNIIKSIVSIFKGCHK